MRTKIGKVILRASDGLVGTAVDLALVNTYFIVLSFGACSRSAIHRLPYEANELLDELNYKTIKQAIVYLAKQGLTKRISKTDIAITELGKKRIAALLPKYYKKRPWDHHIYLVSYDIPTTANKHRTRLREYLKRIGCALLQESLWITPYDPSDILREFVVQHGIEGTVLVSKLGSDGTIGDETFSDLIRRVYHLDKLTERYNTFLDTYEGAKQTKVPLKVAMEYYAILRDDPQLPFHLLPADFPGEKAHTCFRSFCPYTL